MPSANPLPPKESAIFRKILKCYEMKQYKNGLKLAKQILSNPKFTEHGETLAMKGLTLNCLGRKDEAYDHVRRGLRNDLRSHVCWHVYGLLQRSDKKYDEAIKCYRNALKWEKDNIQILRDLSLLQIQMRDLEGYRETRHQLFKLRPNQHASWIGFAMSYHLLGDFETAISILETFEASQTVETFDYKHSELLLYQNQVIRESKNYEHALKHLEIHEIHIFDKLTLKETMGDLCLKLNRHEDAEKIYRELIDRNPENTLYYTKYIESKRLTNVVDIIEAYKGFQETYTHSICPKRLPLNVASGELFRTLVDTFLRRNLRKGVPPLFVNVRSLYTDPEKVQIIQETIHEYYDTLKRSGYFSVADESKSKVDKDLRVEPASALLWTLYFLAQHYDFLRDTQKALDYINEAIEHTPTLIELFVTKGRIYKHAGDVVEAFKWLDEAQSLDTADRYINSKCAKYMLRANKVKEAEEICSKFTREGVPAIENLNEMQCMWFQTECALAYQRLEKWGDSLKKCHEVDRHFSEIIEDQFDFHTYCMRKMTLRSYVDLLRLEDVLRQHPFYFKAAKCAIEVYIRLFDQPLEADSTIEESSLENLPPSELKKLRNKQRKAKKKAELESQQQQQAQVKKEQHNKSRQQQNQDAGDPEAPQLDELIPEKLERPEAPLEKATDFLRPLQLLAKGKIETHLMAFEIYYRKNKPLLMLQALKRSQKLEPNNARLHYQIVKFNKYLETKTNKLNEGVKSVISKSIDEIFGGKAAADFNKDYLDQNKSSFESVLSATISIAIIDQSRLEEARNMMLNLDIETLKLEDCIKIKDALIKYFDVSDAQQKAFIAKSHQKFPYSLKFIPTTYVKADDVDVVDDDLNKDTLTSQEILVA